MSLPRRTFLVGGSHSPFLGKGHPDFIWKRHPDFGTRENPDLEQHLACAVHGALDETGADPARIDRLYIGNFVGELFSNQGHLGAALVGTHPAFSGKPSFRLEGACASGGLAVLGGIDAIQAGDDTILVAGVEVQTTESARVGADYLARASHYRRQRSIDAFTFPAIFAARAKAYRERFDVSERDIARVSVKAFANASCNPMAHMRSGASRPASGTEPLTLELADHAHQYNPCFLANEELNPFLKITDCSQVSDGASALVLVSEQGLAALGKTEADAVEIISTGHAVSSLYEDGEPTSLETTRTAASRALTGAGITTNEVDILEVHDCFAVTELMMMEAIGLCQPGQAGAMVRDGATLLDGSKPINTGGGLIGFGHPVGATGVKQPLEIFRQMKGRCGDYQVSGSLSWGLTANMGGDDKTVVSLALRNLG
ncbi:MAG: hypothetical protein QGG40_09410 [Myxococcota bacterium]|jgi:acetyl-CoA acyltransferase|nr:hypothetical protein [Myxococcota bacterium]